jgi:hypothetical protein
MDARTTRATVALVGALAAALVVVGCLAPWATVRGVSFSGTDANAGKSTIIAAAISAVLLLIATRTGRRWLAIVAAIPAAIAATICVYRLADIANFVQGAPGATASWGIWLATICSLALFLLCLAQAFVPTSQTADATSP